LDTLNLHHAQRHRAYAKLIGDPWFRDSLPRLLERRSLMRLSRRIIDIDLEAMDSSVKASMGRDS